MAEFSISGPSKETDYKTVVIFTPEYGGEGYARRPHINAARDKIWGEQHYGEIIFDLG